MVDPDIDPVDINLSSSHLNKSKVDRQLIDFGRRFHNTGPQIENEESYNVTLALCKGSGGYLAFRFSLGLS